MKKDWAMALQVFITGITSSFLSYLCQCTCDNKMATKRNGIFDNLTRPESGLMLGLFRLIYGVIMIYHIFLHWDRLGYYKDPLHLRFPYPELDWMPLLPFEGLLFVFFLGMLSAVLFTLGIFYRYSSGLMFVAYAYLFSMDALYYNNHYYLLVLLSFLMVFCKADARLTPFRKARFVPYWNYLVLQAQVCIVFFHGGLSKINADWLGGYTLDSEQFSTTQNLFLGWGGMFFDLLIPFALLFRKTRWAAIVLVLLFNVSNHFLFDDIAAYPLLVSASMLIFLEGRSQLMWLQNLFSQSAIVDAVFSWSNGIKSVMVVFFIFQLVFPLRHLIIPGHPEWTGQGHYFSWRMKSYQKQVKLDVFAYDRSTQARKYRINTGLDDYKLQRIGAMPHMILTFADYMKAKLDKIDGADSNLGIAVDYRASLNKLPEAVAIDPSVDLTRKKFNCWGRNVWILKKPER